MRREAMITMIIRYEMHFGVSYETGDTHTATAEERLKGRWLKVKVV